jgi:hypothetical protein
MDKATQRLILFFSIFDSLIATWFGVWFVAIFARHLSSESISIRSVVWGVTELLLAIYIVKRMQVPSVRVLLTLDVLCYANLFLLLVSFDWFYVVGGAMAAICVKSQMVFNRVIFAQNLPEPDDRIRFDNKHELMRTIGGTIGGLIALLYLFESWDVRLQWLLMYLIYDLDFFLKLFLIGRGRIKYDALGKG